MAEALQQRIGQEQGRERSEGPLSGGLLAGAFGRAPVAERRLLLAGSRPPCWKAAMGPGHSAARPRERNSLDGDLPGLTAAHRVIVPDLPGHGASEVTAEDRIDSGRVMEWLGELIRQTCRRHRLWWVNCSEAPLRPATPVSTAIGSVVSCSWTLAFVRSSRHRSSVSPCPGFLVHPTERTHADLWWHRPGRAAQRLGEWQPFEAYNLDRPARRAFGRRLLR